MELAGFSRWIESSRITGKRHDDFAAQQRPLSEFELRSRASLLDAIKICGKQNNVGKGIWIHAFLLGKGVLYADIGLCNSLLSMYTKFGMLSKAREMFDQFPARSVVTWNALISGYAQHGLIHAAFDCFEKMKDEGLFPNAVTYVSILKVCGGARTIDKGKEIHDEIDKGSLLGKHVELGAALVDMYLKCSMLAKAQEVFDRLQTRDATTWTVLINGYVQHGCNDQALSCFSQMQNEDIDPDAITYRCVLKACRNAGSIKKGKEIHAEISKRGLMKKDIELSNAIVDMYANCGLIAVAQEVFDTVATKNVVTWNALIAGYVDHGLHKEALALFEKMQDEGFPPNAVTFMFALKACSSMGYIVKGEEIHAAIQRHGNLENDVVLGSALVDFYAKCGTFEKAKEVFNELATPNVTTWTALIVGYVQYGLGDQALDCFTKMQEAGVSPNEVTLAATLKACGITGAILKGEEIHAEIDRQGLLETDIVLGTALVDMYARCGFLANARKVMNQLPVRNLATWTALICGYAEHGLGEKALDCVEQMVEEGHSPNIVTFLCMLKACGTIGALEKGEEVHAQLEGQGLLQENIELSTAVVDMYCKCGKMGKARNVFNELWTRDVVSWTTLMTGYAQLDHNKEVLCCFEQMKNEGISPNVITLPLIFKACGNVGALNVGEELHYDLETKGLLAKNIVLGTAVVDMYAKGGALAKAQGLFDRLPSRDVALYNALIFGYAQHGLGEKSLRYLEKMQKEGLHPNAITFTCALQACTSLAAPEKGEVIHADIHRQGLLEKHMELGTALVDMYVKCGKLASAQNLFEKLSPARGLATWTALMAGYAQVGMVEKICTLFEQMVEEGIEPSAVTFLVMLAACSHAGLLEEGQMYFNLMCTVYCIVPTVEHFICMVDIFSRAGHFDKAIGIIRKAPPSDCLRLCLALMGACQRLSNVEIGRWAFDLAVKLDKTLPVAYTYMKTIYADAGMKAEKHEIEILRIQNGA